MPIARSAGADKHHQLVRFAFRQIERLESVVAGTARQYFNLWMVRRSENFRPSAAKS